MHNRPAAVEDDEVERKAREFGRSRVGDDEIGATIAALILETVELDPDRRRRFGAGRGRPTKQRAPSKKGNVARSRRDPARSPGEARSTDETATLPLLLARLSRTARRAVHRIVGFSQIADRVVSPSFQRA